MKLKSITAALLLAISSAASAQLASPGTAWYEETTENRPFVRWWWLGSAVDPEGLTFNLEEFARQGLGGVEITPIYGVKGNEANDISYLSPEWMEMLDYTTAEANRLGLQVDMNNGTGWPFGGPEITPELSARKLVTETWTLDKGQKITSPIVPSDAKQAPVAKLQKVIAVNGDRRIDITSKVDKNGMLKWKAPTDGWIAYAIFSGRTFQKVKRAAPGGEGYVLNHYDSIAVKKYLEKFDAAFAGHEKSIPHSFFNDSYEVYGSDWADNILDVFERDHGYRLEMYIPEFISADHSDLRARVVRDYRATLAGMLSDNFTDIWTRWAHSRGAKIRNQSHGSPANILDIYAAVDIPECESFGQSDFDIPGLVRNGDSRPSDADPAVLKFASSAAHLAGRPLTSAETLTWLTEHFHTSLARCKPEIDQMLASGVNHVYFHGAPYSPAGVEFPGWLFYASINMSPTNSIWNDAAGLMKYITRNQAFLSAGNPDNDFLVYFPIEDVWYRQGGRPYLMFDIHKMQQRMPDIKECLNRIIDAGYDVDYISDALLDSITPTAYGTLLSRGNNDYKAVIVPPVNIMAPATLRRMLGLAEAGATVIFTGKLPDDVPGLNDLDARRKELYDVLAEMPVYTPDTIIPFGKGRLIYASDYESGMKLSGASPEPLRINEGIHMLRRKNEAGGHNYFIAMLGNDTISGAVTLATPGISAMIFDPLTGKSGLAETVATTDSSMTVSLQLLPGQTLLVKTFPDKVEAPAWEYTVSTGQPMTLDRGWTLSFLESEPAVTDTFAIDSIMDWTRLPIPEAKQNFGTGRYTVRFTLDDPSLADDWILDAGDVRESARVTVNGHDAGTIWSVPFSLSVGEWLKPGENEIILDVTSLQANRIAQFERDGVEWRKFKDANIASVTNARTFSFGDWETVPCGLNSKVTLTPVKKSITLNPIQ
ncbi:MAG: glycosyl hydrolase family 2 [Duncaniella sp.]|nr:glycosyl hydrolase family 2 [Duncaniella sp.]